MKLHEHPNEFNDLISIVAFNKHLPESAIERDYYIVLLLKRLAESEYCDRCVFKGGTSLSKCYPGSIERFSEDIDLTYLGMDESDKLCEKTIKRIETIMSNNASIEKIEAERSTRSKSMYVWFNNKDNRIKLEIGSNVRPDPYSKRKIKTYIQEFLEENNGNEDISKFALEAIELNVLNIERTFVDKLMSIKRHAICGTINTKVRHIYDVVRLYGLPEIQMFLKDEEEFKRLISITKKTDSFYLQKRNINKEYNPVEPYNFQLWKHHLDETVKTIYENLHIELLYTDEKQNFDDAIRTIECIDEILKEIEE